MAISRRMLLRRVGVGVAIGTLAPARRSSGALVARETIRLNRNENAYGPSRRTVAAMQDAAAQAAFRYPDVESDVLRARIANLHGVSTDDVVLGCGVSELLRTAVDTFVGPGGKVVTSVPTFDVIGRCAQRAGVEVVAVSLARDYSHDLDAMLARIDRSTRLVYISNPNNPTGTLTRRHDLETFLGKLPATTFVLIDEAYHHYVARSPAYGSFVDRPVDAPRVVAVRTFSKIHGLAGLRIGYAVARSDTARLLASRLVTEDVNIVATKAALAALDDSEHVRLSASRNTDDRQEFFNQAMARMLPVIDSQTNFVMVKTNRPAGEIVEHFRRNGVLLSGPFPGFPTHVRVSLGTPEDMREFWRVWDLLPNQHHMAM
jgi:histidinol-phosphate aminotransferase